MTSYQNSLAAMYDDVYLDILNVITSIKTLRNQSLATIGNYGLVFVYFLTNFEPSLSGSPAALQEGVLAWVPSLQLFGVPREGQRHSYMEDKRYSRHTCHQITQKTEFIFTYLIMNDFLNKAILSKTC